jgi:hypothetical protein
MPKAADCHCGGRVVISTFHVTERLDPFFIAVCTKCLFALSIGDCSAEDATSAWNSYSLAKSAALDAKVETLVEHEVDEEGDTLECKHLVFYCPWCIPKRTVQLDVHFSAAGVDFLRVKCSECERTGPTKTTMGGAAWAWNEFVRPEYASRAMLRDLSAIKNTHSSELDFRDRVQRSLADKVDEQESLAIKRLRRIEELEALVAELSGVSASRPRRALR